MNQARQEVVLTNEVWFRYEKEALERLAQIIAEESSKKLFEGANPFDLLAAGKAEMEAYQYTIEMFRRVVFGVTCDDPECQCHEFVAAQNAQATQPQTDTQPATQPAKHNGHHPRRVMIVPNKKEVV